MNRFRHQSGVVLAVTLIMLTVLTLIGVTAIMMSTTQFRLVGNLQAAYETEMIGRNALLQYVADHEASNLPFACGTVTRTVTVGERSVAVCITPRCVGKTVVPPNDGSLTGSGVPHTHWDITATTQRDELSASTSTHACVEVSVSDLCPVCPDPPSSCNPD